MILMIACMLVASRIASQISPKSVYWIGNDITCNDAMRFSESSVWKVLVALWTSIITLYMLHNISNSLLYLEQNLSFVLGCGGVFTTPTGNIQSPGYSNAYPHNANCEWNITVAEFQTVQISFKDFDLEAHDACIYDYVAVSGISCNLFYLYNVSVSGYHTCT